MATPLTPEVIQCAVVMINRAQCSGEEAKNVAITIDTLLAHRNELLQDAMAAQIEGDAEEDDGDDS